MLLPTVSPYVSGEISVFEKLVQAGEAESFVTLPYPIHLFLVGVLVDHLYDVKLFRESVALNLMNATTKMRENGREQANELLMRAGDEGLLIAGLFPETARRLNVSPSYFRFMGQAAYASLSARHIVTGANQGSFFDTVAEAFPVLEKVLKATRSNPEEEAKLNAFLRSIP